MSKCHSRKGPKDCSTRIPDAGYLPIGPLVLLDAVELPVTKQRPANIRCHLCPNARYFGVLAYKVLLRVYERVGERLLPSFSYPLPPTATDFALHPNGELLALATHHQIQIVQHRTDGVAIHDFGPERGEIRALCFSRNGRVLWVSVEDVEGVSHLHALDGETLKSLDSVEVAGISDSHHSLVQHPQLELIAVEVSCGQEGSWVTFVEILDGKLRRLPPGLAREGDPLFMAGFAPDGRSFVGVTQARLHAWSWPECASLSEFHPATAGWVLNWQGAHVGECFVAPISDVEEEHFRLLVLEGTSLKLEYELTWQAADQSCLLGVYAFTPDLLLVVGDKRIGMFRFCT
jgi:hypothetical protein